MGSEIDEIIGGGEWRIEKRGEKVEVRLSPIFLRSNRQLEEATEVDQSHVVEAIDSS